MAYTVRWYFLKLQTWQLSEREYLYFPDTWMNFFLLLLTNVAFSSAFGLKFKTICRREPDAAVVSSITVWLWKGFLYACARWRPWVEGWWRETETDSVWFKWGIKRCASQGRLRSCPTDRTTLFAEMKPSSGCFQPSSDSRGETSCWIQHNRINISHRFLRWCLSVFSFGVRVLLQQFNFKFQSFWTTLTFNLPSTSWQFLSWFAVIKN